MRQNRQVGALPAQLAPPRKVAAGLRRPLRAGELIGSHHHDRHQLVYPARGLLAVTTAQGTWMAPPHRAVWVPADAEHQHRAWGETDMRAVLFRAGTRDPFRAPAVVAVTALLRELVLALTAGPQSPGPRGRMEAVVLDQLTASGEQPLHLPDASDGRLRAALALLRADPGSQLTLAEIGLQVAASERTLSRLFRSELGMTFPQWRNQLRVQHALTLLAGGRSVTRAAADTGWTSTSAFIEAFAQITGVTPGRFLAEARATT